MAYDAMVQNHQAVSLPSTQRCGGLRTLLCAERTQTVFRYSAWWMVMVAIYMALAIQSHDWVILHEVPRVIMLVAGAVLGSVGAFAGLLVLAGMLAYLFVCDRSTLKAIWLVAILLAGCFGTTLYYFVVYRKQMAQREGR